MHGMEGCQTEVEYDMCVGWVELPVEELVESSQYPYLTGTVDEGSASAGAYAPFVQQ